MKAVRVKTDMIWDEHLGITLIFVEKTDIIERGQTEPMKDSQRQTLRIKTMGK